VVVVLAGEQERGSLAVVGVGQRLRVSLDLGRQFGILAVLDQLEQLHDVGRALVEIRPQGDLGSEAVGLAKDPLRVALVLPEARLLGQGLQLGEVRFLAREVKDAPMSIGCALPARGSLRRPP
jgi:hypothetical protein